MSRITDLFTPQLRYRIYLVLTAVVPLLVLYGWLDQTAAAVWIGVISAVLGTGMAAANTPTTRKEPVSPPDRGEWPPQ